MRMRKLGRMIRRRYLTASVFLAAFLAVTAIDAVLPSRDRQALAAWASTSVANLEHHPVASLVLSAFIAGGSAAIWPVLIALALFGANRALGSVRAAVIFAAAHVIGTLVSEGIVAYRVDAGLLPVSSRHLLDVGPSYVVVAAAVRGAGVRLLAGPGGGGAGPGRAGHRRPDLRRPQLAGRGGGRSRHRDGRRGLRGCCCCACARPGAPGGRRRIRPASRGIRVRRSQLWHEPMRELTM